LEPNAGILEQDLMQKEHSGCAALLRNVMVWVVFCNALFAGFVACLIYVIC
jgi:hypothetical protein